MYLPRLANALWTCGGEASAFDFTSNQSLRNTICCRGLESALHAVGVSILGQQLSNCVWVVCEHHDYQWDDWVDGDLRYVLEILSRLEEAGN